MATKPKVNFGPFIRDLRMNAGLGLREASREIGISAAYLSRVENGVDNPSGKLLEQLARLYDVSLEVLTRRAKPKASAVAHGRAMQSSPELRALYRLGAQLNADELEVFIRRFLVEKGFSEPEVEKQLAQLKDELPRVSNSARDGLFAVEAKPRFLTKQKISRMAYDRLAMAGLTEQNYKPPTQIELLVDSEEGVLYRIQELKADKHGNPLVLGLTGWDEAGNRQIVINSLLADSGRESDVHRFNFTLGHELFHALEHLPRIRKENSAPLNRSYLGKAIFCDAEPTRFRSTAERFVNSWIKKTDGPRNLETDEDWREWQANVYSSALLMPEWSVAEEFNGRISAQDFTLNFSGNPRETALQLAGETNFGSVFYEQSMADLFEVSRQAMAIRLLELGLIKEVED